MHYKKLSILPEFKSVVGTPAMLDPPQIEEREGLETEVPSCNIRVTRGLIEAVLTSLSCRWAWSDQPKLMAYFYTLCIINDQQMCSVSATHLKVYTYFSSYNQHAYTFQQYKTINTSCSLKTLLECPFLLGVVSHQQVLHVAHRLGML